MKIIFSKLKKILKILAVSSVFSIFGTIFITILAIFIRRKKKSAQDIKSKR